MDWVHCNICYLQPGDKKGKKFELTSCGHIYCVECRKACVVDVCKICSNNCTTVELEAEMRADVQQFFDDPGSELKKIVRIIEFQEGHRQRLTSHRRMTAAKFQAAKAEIHKLRRKIEELEKEIRLLRQQSVLTSTPVDVFQRPSPPAAWNLTPRHPSTPQSKMSPLSPANSEGWVTPNRLTLKRTPSPSNRPLSLPPSVQSLGSCQGLGKQRKSPLTPCGVSSSQKPGMHPKLHALQPTNLNTSRGSFRVHRGYSTQPSPPLTPIHSNVSHYSRDSQNVSPSPRLPSRSFHRGTTPISSGSLLSNLKLTSPV